MHIEPTSRCTLSCPACSRTVFSNFTKQPFPKYDLDVEDLSRFLDCESGTQVKDFVLNGNHGDPIYYPHLFSLIDKFRESKTFKISTNGSYQTVEFWENLRSRLTDNDTVYFSIDGLEDTNHLYRVNADWPSIMQGIDIMSKGPAKIVWKSIVFSFNQHQLPEMSLRANEKRIEFFHGYTSRFGQKEFEPSNTDKVDQNRLYTNIKDQPVELDPQCNSREYIAADGYYWPCCWISNYESLFSSKLWKERSLWSIKNQTLDTARLRLENWKESILSNPQSAHVSCKLHCKKGQKSSNAWLVDQKQI